MDTLTVALASLGGVVLAGVIAHGAWQARRAGPKQASSAREEPSAAEPIRGDGPGLDDADAAAADDPAAVSSRRLSMNNVLRSSVRFWASRISVRLSLKLYEADASR